MQTFKINDTEIETLCSRLKEANKASADNAKEIETCKALLKDKLKHHRNVTVEALNIGDILKVNDCLLLEIGSMNKFDEKAFSLKHPDIHAKFKRDIRVTKFKPTL